MLELQNGKVLHFSPFDFLLLTIDGQLYTGLVDVNADFTFDLFVCLAILVSHRTELSMCHDLASIYNTING